jgi:molybdopterin biosynthesis enzyme MoaB
MAKKGNEVRTLLERLGHKVYFSEELIFDKSYQVPANLQERIQVSEMDAIVCGGINQRSKEI